MHRVGSAGNTSNSVRPRKEKRLTYVLSDADDTKEESQLAKITRDSAKITVEQVHGLMSQVIKDILFNSVRQPSRSRTESSGPEPMVET